jgi:hypothetical protein
MIANVLALAKIAPVDPGIRVQSFDIGLIVLKTRATDPGKFGGGPEKVGKRRIMNNL